MLAVEPNFCGLYDVLEKFDRVALAVSGGADSTALMVACARWAKTHDRLGDVHVVCVDHKLRDNSTKEAEQVCNVAGELGLQSHILTWVHDGVESAVQEKARKARYQLLADWCQANEVPVILTGHHQDDQIETMVMRLLHGSGVDGLAGMAAEGNIFGARVLRPFLEIKRAALRAYVAQQGVKWIEDPSNGNEKFERVRVRGGIAALVEQGLDVDGLAMSARRIARAQLALEGSVDGFMSTAVTVFDTGYASIDRSMLDSVPVEIALRTLRRVVVWASGGALPVQLSKLERVYEALRAGDETKMTLAGAAIAARKKHILIGREYGRKGLGNVVSNGVWDNRFIVGDVRVRPYGDIIDSDNRARPDDLPHFVACCLPAILDNQGGYLVPHLDFVDDIDRKNMVMLKKLPKGMKKTLICRNSHRLG